MIECTQINACTSLLCYMGVSLELAMTFNQFLKVVNNCRISEMKWIFVLYFEYVDISNEGLFFRCVKYPL